MIKKNKKSSSRHFILDDHHGLEKIWYVVFILLLFILVAVAYAIFQVKDLNERIDEALSSNSPQTVTSTDDALTEQVLGDEMLPTEDFQALTGSRPPLAAHPRVFGQTWSDGVEFDAVTVSEIVDGKAQGIFTGNPRDAVLGFYGDVLIYHRANENYDQYTVRSYDIKSKEDKELFALDRGNYVTGGAVFPDGTLIYGEQCGIVTCVASDKKPKTIISRFDIKTGVKKVLLTEEDRFQGFKVPGQIVDEQTITLDLGYEATEGNPYLSELYLLNILSGELTSLPIEEKATFYTVDGVGGYIYYSTFDYSGDLELHESKIVRMDFAGSKIQLDSSPDLEYREMFWDADHSLFVTATAIESIEQGLGYYVRGPRRLYNFSSAGEVVEVLDLAEDAGRQTPVLHSVVADQLYYATTEVAHPLTYDRLHAFDLNQKTDKVVMESGRSIKVYTE